MAVAGGNSQADMAKVLRDLADQAEAGTVEIVNIVIQNELHDIGVDSSGFYIREDFGLREMEVSYRVIKTAPKPRHIAIDTAEHPMLNSDPSLGEYIKRVLIELGFKGEYKSYKMVTRPGKAPLLEVEGAV